MFARRKHFKNCTIFFCFIFSILYFIVGAVSVWVLRLSTFAWIQQIAMLQHICKAQCMMMLLAFAIFGFAVGAFYCHQHHHISKSKLNIAHALSARNQTHLTLLNKIRYASTFFSYLFSLTPSVAYFIFMRVKIPE